MLMDPENHLGHYIKFRINPNRKTKNQAYSEDFSEFLHRVFNDIARTCTVVFVAKYKKHTT